MGNVGPETESIKLAGHDPFQPNVPDIACPVPNRVEEHTSSRHRILDVVKKVDADAGGMAAEDRKIDAVASCGRSKWKGHTRSDRLDFAKAQQTLKFIESLTLPLHCGLLINLSTGLWDQNFHELCWVWPILDMANKDLSDSVLVRKHMISLADLSCSARPRLT